MPYTCIVPECSGSISADFSGNNLQGNHEIAITNTVFREIEDKYTANLEILHFDNIIFLNFK